MKFLNKLIKNKTKFQRIFGLQPQQLEILVIKLNPLWDKAETERLTRAERKRGIGAGHPYALKTFQEKVWAVLLYYKLHLTQEVLGLILRIDQSAVSRLLKKMLPLIEQASDPSLRTYLAQAKEDLEKNKISSIKELFDRYPDLRDISTDATEQQCYRSTNYETQKKYYSGKSKQHTIKTQTSVSLTGRIIDVSESYPGSVHDKSIIDQEKTVKKIPKEVPHRFDSGYQGVKSDCPDYYLILPTKKPRSRELTPLEKEHNKANSKRRVVAEHAFAQIKKFKICAGVYRQSLETYNQTFRNVVALINFRQLHSVVPA
jgi:hypothetical protein